ncbi:MAG: hypothetical protein RSD48_03825, partial [Oscillospiraceae bacterium]
ARFFKGGTSPLERFLQDELPGFDKLNPARWRGFCKAKGQPSWGLPFNYADLVLLHGAGFEKTLMPRKCF